MPQLGRAASAYGDLAARLGGIMPGPDERVVGLILGEEAIEPRAACLLRSDWRGVSGLRRYLRA